MGMDTRTNTFVAVMLAIALGFVAHALVGYAPFPFSDDFAYAPLAELRANPDLFPRDDQLRMFANHAFVYDWLYTLGRNGPGVEPVFRIAVWGLSIAVCIAILFVLKGMKAPAAFLPVVLGLGVIVQTDGLGRGDFGGLVSQFFHHQNVALALVMGAVAASLWHRPLAAALCLGLAAYAQPMTAFHGAGIVGLGTLLARPRETLVLAGVSALVALPAVLLILDQMPSASAIAPGLNLIEDAYRFRAPAHYDPSWQSIGLATLYLLAGFAGAALFARVHPATCRFVLGVAIAFALLHLVTVVVYKLRIGETTALFILDANRSSPLAFVLGTAFAVAGMWRRGLCPASVATGVLLAGILAMNGTLAGLAVIAFGVLLLAVDRYAWGPSAGLAAAVAGAIALFPPKPLSGDVPVEVRAFFERIRVETPEDSLFVVPISAAAFRLHTQRSAYVDFKMFSVAQPEQAALTRHRIEVVTNPSPAMRRATGWAAAYLWDREQHKVADCARMISILKEAGADYYLRLVDPGESAPDCPDLPRPISSGTLSLYGPPPP